MTQQPSVSDELVLGKPSPVRSVAAIVLASILLVVLAVASLFVGSGHIGPAEVLRALTSDGQTTTDLLVRDFRLPRTILALLTGLALALAGVVMQALTRNPLADPGLLGVNSGAYFFVVLGSAFLGASATTSQVIWGILGAGVAAVVVYVLGTTGPGAGTPAKLVLSGVAIAAVLTGISYAIALAKPTVFDKVRFWSAGSIQGRSWDSVLAVWWLILLGAVIVVCLAGALNALSMGDDMARALGANLTAIRSVGFIAVTILCGAATSVVGPITFVGLMVPFVAKFIVGVDHRWVITFSIFAGPTLLIASDMIARVIIASEMPVGLVTAFLGAPVLIILVRRTRMSAI